MLQKSLRDFVKSINLSKSKLVNYNPYWADNQQYVIGGVEDSELCLVYCTYLPQVDSIKEDRVKFIVFSSIENSMHNLTSLTNILHHSSLWHDTVLKVFALSDFNLVP